MGCGSNPFKQLVKNCYGIDPANPAADEMTAIQDFVALQLYDVATCLGSINLGNEERIAAHIDCVVRCMRPVIHNRWRLNSRRCNHGNATCEDILRLYADRHK